MGQAESLDNIYDPFLSLPHTPQPLSLLRQEPLDQLPTGKLWHEFLTALEVGSATPQYSYATYAYGVPREHLLGCALNATQERRQVGWSKAGKFVG